MGGLLAATSLIPFICRRFPCVLCGVCFVFGFLGLRLSCSVAMSGQGALHVGGRRRQPRRPKGTPNSIAAQPQSPGPRLTGKPGRGPTGSGRPGTGLRTAGGTAGTGRTRAGSLSSGASAAGTAISTPLTGCRPTGGPAAAADSRIHSTRQDRWTGGSTTGRAAQRSTGIRAAGCPRAEPLGEGPRPGQLSGTRRPDRWAGGSTGLATSSSPAARRSTEIRAAGHPRSERPEAGPRSVKISGTQSSGWRSTGLRREAGMPAVRQPQSRCSMRGRYPEGAGRSLLPGSSWMERPQKP